MLRAFSRNRRRTKGQNWQRPKKRELRELTVVGVSCLYVAAGLQQKQKKDKGAELAETEEERVERADCHGRELSLCCCGPSAETEEGPGERNGGNKRRKRGEN